MYNKIGRHNTLKSGYCFSSTTAVAGFCRPSETDTEHRRNNICSHGPHGPINIGGQHILFIKLK